MLLAGEGMGFFDVWSQGGLLSPFSAGMEQGRNGTHECCGSLPTALPALSLLL